MLLNKYQTFLSNLNIIAFPNYLGQRLKSAGNSPLQVAKYLGWFQDHNKFHNLDNKLGKKLDVNLEILYQTNKSISGKRINIGGDHSMAIASLADSLQRYDDLKVIWIDAHPDINTRKSSSTQNYHGMPLAFLSGLDVYPELDYLSTIKKLDLTNLVYIGIRDIDGEEQKFIENHNIKYYSVSETLENTSNVISILENWIADSQIHISFDVDSLDPEVLDSTGTPVPGGIDLLTIQRILYFMGNKNWVNMDITEVNLSLGNPEKSLANLKKIMDKFVEGSISENINYSSKILHKL